MADAAETDIANLGELKPHRVVNVSNSEIVDGNFTPIDQLLGRNTQRDTQNPSYYDLSILKAPVWTPEVSAYFTLGGISAGALIIARSAARFGGKDCSDITRFGTYIAAAAAIPCAPLLIIDLGDPKRFHHMLRVFKPLSPMNVGSWALTSFTSGLIVSTVLQFLKDGQTVTVAKFKTIVNGITLLADIVGLPSALLLAGYTGVLLSTTSTPVWCKNPFLGALFMSSAINTGCAAIRLATGLKQLKLQVRPSKSSERALCSICSVAHSVEAGFALAFVLAAGCFAKPLMQGGPTNTFIAGGLLSGIVLPEIIEHIPVPKKLQPWLKVAACFLTLIGGHLLRHSIVQAGRPSALDPETARANSRPKSKS